MKRKIIEIGDLCRHCNTPVILKDSKFKESKLKKDYYYSKILYCTNCKAIYLIERYKVTNKQYGQTLF